MNVKARLESFKHASHGIAGMIRLAVNARIQAACAIAAVVAGIACKVNAIDWALIAICIGMVLAAEAFNTAIEQLADEVDESHNPRIRIVKDLSAGAVLLTAVTSLIVAAFVFGDCF